MVLLCLNLKELLLSGIHKKSFDLLGHYTSVSLETEFWDALADIAKERACSIRKIVLEIDDDRLKSPLLEGQLSFQNLSSSIRVFILNYYRNRGGK